MAPNERANSRGRARETSGMKKGQREAACNGNVARELLNGPLSNADLYLFLELAKSVGKDEAVRWLAKEIILKKTGGDRSRSVSRRSSIQSMQDIAENLYYATRAESPSFKDESEDTLTLRVGNTDHFKISSCRTESMKFPVWCSDCLTDKT